ncbi:MAG: hypothetical protein WAT19_00505 [Ferruginibacter sp.]
MKKQENKLVQKDIKEKKNWEEEWDKDPEEPLEILPEDLADTIPDEEEIPIVPYEAPEPGEGP